MKGRMENSLALPAGAIRLVGSNRNGWKFLR